MYEALVITPVVLSLFVTLALELWECHFDSRRFAEQRAARAERSAVAARQVVERLPSFPLQQAA